MVSPASKTESSVAAPSEPQQPRKADTLDSETETYESTFEKIREGSLEEAWLTFAALIFKAGQHEKLRSHAITEAEESGWVAIQLEKYPELGKREAAKRIKAETQTHRTVEAIRKHLF